MKIVNSAIRKNGVVYIGRRHHKILGDKSRPFGFLKNGEQGFVADTGIFVNREQAAILAYDSKQISIKKKRLYNEDLW